MKLKIGKNRYGFGLCIAVSALIGAAAWYAASADDFNIKPVKEPAMEVSEPWQEKEREEKIRTHIVSEGENLSQIAEKYHIDTATLQGANEGLTETIKPGQKLLVLPRKGVLYKVQAGDSLWEIARLFHIDAAALLQANKRSGDLIEAGERLFIPGAEPLEKPLNHMPVSRNAEAKFILPATGEISSPFGRRWGRMHNGVDIADDYGTPVRAALGGKVVYAGWISGYGYSVMLEHQNGYSTLYGHMQAVLVEAGQRVRQGQSLGKMGSTGNSTGPHVHFEVRKDGALINPFHVLR